jgi:hypothetical protein
MVNTSFADLKKSRQAQIEKLTQEINKVSTPQQSNNGPDERFWEPTVDKAGNGYAVIRFLPAPKGEDFPFVRVFSHGFKGPSGSWYIENSLTTIGKSDPVSDYNTTLWNSGSEADKEQARAQKRKLHFISNILVVKDSENPENEGKVFLYKYGKKIFDKINYLMDPEFDDEAPVNPFDFWEGANFKLKIRKVDGYRNYDKSEFDSSSAISDDDDELEAIWKQQHSLQEFIDPKNFKTYEELKTKLDRVLGLTNVPGKLVELTAEAPKGKQKFTEKTKESKTEMAFDDDDDDLEHILGKIKD